MKRMLLADMDAVVLSALGPTLAAVRGRVLTLHPNFYDRHDPTHRLGG